MSTVAAVVGKHEKPDDEKTGPVLEVRVIFESNWATHSVQIPSSSATTSQELFAAVQHACPFIKDASRADQPFAATKFFLQETSNECPDLRTVNFLSALWDSPETYDHWFERNVTHGKARTLKVEVCLQTFKFARTVRRTERRMAIKG